MAKNWTSALYEHSKKPIKTRKQPKTGCAYCGRLLPDYAFKVINGKQFCPACSKQEGSNGS